MVETPMFPLGTVLFPGMPLPLHLFESRYRTMIRDVLAGDGTFGVCLIERGSEVGGGDVRTAIGTLARVVKAQELDDGRWQVLAIGTDRIGIDAWLPDDPYPRAAVTPDPDPTVTPQEAERIAPLAARVQRFRQRIASRRGMRIQPVDVPADVVAASYVLAAATPVGEFDNQRLLAASTVGLRLELLGLLLDELEELEALDGDRDQP